MMAMKPLNSSSQVPSGLAKIVRAAEEKLAVRPLPQHDDEADHHEIDEGAGDVEECLDPSHAAPEDDDMEGPDQDEGEPVDPGQPEKLAPAGNARERADQERERRRGEIDLHAVPEDRHGRAQDRGQFRPRRPHGGAREDRIRDAVFLARRAREVHEEHDHQARGDQRREGGPAAHAVGDEKRGDERVAEERLNVIRPDIEDREPAPGLLRLRDRAKRIFLARRIGMCHLVSPAVKTNASKIVSHVRKAGRARAYRERPRCPHVTHRTPRSGHSLINQ